MFILIQSNPTSGYVSFYPQKYRKLFKYIELEQYLAIYNYRKKY